MILSFYVMMMNIYIYMMIHGHKFISQQSVNRIYSVDTKSKSDNNKLAQSFLVKKNCQNICFIYYE